MKLKRINESVTFTLKGEAERANATPCHKCGLTTDMASRINIDHDPICDICYDMGGSFNEYEMNVANTNARAILDALNISDHQNSGLYGSINPQELLSKIALICDTSKYVKAPTISQGVRITDQGVGPGMKMYDAGRTQEQFNNYLYKLQAIAQRAIELGEPIIYG